MGNERSLDWMQLLPSGSELFAARLPAALRELLRVRTASNGDTYLGYRTSASEVPNLERYRAVALVKPRGLALISRLRDAGFPHILAFSVIPSLANPRVFLPIGNARVTMRAIELLAAYRPDARVKKALLICLARMHGVRHVGDILLLARRTKSDLEHQLEQMTGLPQVHLALSPGASGEFRKLTVQVMTEVGEVVAFAKLARSAAARDAVSRESATLADLGQYSQLAGSVPKALGITTIGDALLTLQTPGQGRIAPASFSQVHNQFLMLKATASSRRLPFSRSLMRNNIEAALATLEPHLSPTWRECLTATLVVVDRAFEMIELDLEIAHRDFGPWNCRIQPNGQLFVFDWETAQQEMVPLYDLFDFHLRSHVLLRVRADTIGFARELLAAGRRWCPETSPTLVPYFLLAYLLDRALSRLRYARWRKEEAGDTLLTLLAELLETQAYWLHADSER